MKSIASKKDQRFSVRNEQSTLGEHATTGNTGKTRYNWARWEGPEPEAHFRAGETQNSSRAANGGTQ